MFSNLVGIANYAIYMAIIDYTVAAYSLYAASTTGENGYVRDFLTAIVALCASLLYKNIGGKYRFLYISILLAYLAVAVIILIYIFYYKRPQIRVRSKFVQLLKAKQRKKIKKVKELEMRRRGGI